VRGRNARAGGPAPRSCSSWADGLRRERAHGTLRRRPASEDALRVSHEHDVKSMNEMFPLEQRQAAYDHMMSSRAVSARGIESSR